jgi:hypothetical protein
MCSIAAGWPFNATKSTYRDDTEMDRSCQLVDQTPQVIKNNSIIQEFRVGVFEKKQLFDHNSVSCH